MNFLVFASLFLLEFRLSPKMIDYQNQSVTIEKLYFLCPSCQRELLRTDLRWICPSEKFSFETSIGIPDFILPFRREKIESFLSIYQKVRSTEGWGSSSIDYYFALPYQDRAGNHRRIWKMRGRTFDCFAQHLAARNRAGPLRVLDVGAGNCWMSIRLAELGHQVIAVDINLDLSDGLGVASKLNSAGLLKFSCVRAEFDYLPFPEASFDVIAFNASLHYSTNIKATLLRTLRLLTENGALYILDSPIYHDVESGKAMVHERQVEFRKKYRLSVPDEFAGNFLTFEQLNQLQPEYKVEYLTPHYGLFWNLRQILAFLLSKREPASFEIVKVQKKSILAFHPSF